MSRRGCFLTLLLAAATACGDDDDDVVSDGDADADSDTDADTDADADTDTDADADADPVACTDPDPAFTPEEQMLVDLPADSWWQAPGTPMRAVCPADREGCANAIAAWSGGAYDARHRRMLVWGGGHADYSGNEVYAFDLATLTWSRLTEPSPAEYQSQDPLPDGQPVSRHSYDGLQVATHANVFVAHGGSRWQDGSGTGVTWAFDLDAATWQNMEPEGAPSLSNCCSEASAYDPDSGAIFFHLTNRLARYDVDANRWEVLLDLGFPPYWPRYEVWGDKRGLVDPTRGLVWFFGAGLYMVWDIAAGAAVTDDWVTTGGALFSNAESVDGYPEQVIETGGGEVITEGGPGVDYDLAADQIVGWVGGGPWRLDLEARAWSQGSGAGAPAAPVDNGTFGRFRYVARTNVFVLVNSVDDDVWFYKNTAACGH